MFLFMSQPSTKLIHQNNVQRAVLCSAVVDLGIYLQEDAECTVTFCGVGLWAGLTGYCQKHVAVLVHWRCLEINDSPVESHGEDAFYGAAHKGKCAYCVCKHFVCFAQGVSYCVRRVHGNMHAFTPRRTSSISIISRPQNINLACLPPL